MIGGHFAAKVAAQGRGLVVMGVAYIFLTGAGVGSLAIHLYTTYRA
jgi:hypothetical protein